MSQAYRDAGSCGQRHGFSQPVENPVDFGPHGVERAVRGPICTGLHRSSADSLVAVLAD
jgi:hypothetical protein